MSPVMRRRQIGGSAIVFVMFLVLLQTLSVGEALLTVLLPGLVAVAAVALIAGSIERNRAAK